MRKRNQVINLTEAGKAALEAAEASRRAKAEAETEPAPPPVGGPCYCAKYPNPHFHGANAPDERKGGENGTGAGKAGALSPTPPSRSDAPAAPAALETKVCR